MRSSIFIAPFMAAAVAVAQSEVVSLPSTDQSFDTKTDRPRSKH